MSISSALDLSHLREQYATEPEYDRSTATPVWVPLYMWLQYRPESIDNVWWERLGDIILWFRPIDYSYLPSHDTLKSEIPWISISNAMRYAARFAGCSEYQIYYCLHTEVYPRLGIAPSWENN